MATITRRYEYFGVRCEMGRSSIEIECPFCGSMVRAYVWSLAGVGKRCPCGAKFHHNGSAIKEVAEGADDNTDRDA